MTTPLPKYLSNEGGAVAIEAVFIVPVLLTLVFGAVDGALLLLANQKLESGLTAAGNFLARSSTPQNFEEEARRIATTASPKTGGTSRISGWNPQDVTIAYQQIANPTIGGLQQYRGSDQIQIIQLSTEYDFHGIGIVAAFKGGKIRLHANHQERLINGT